MRQHRSSLVFLGLALSSSWGNGHATAYRALLKALAGRGYDITSLERDVPWHADNRDLRDPAFCRLCFYSSLKELRHRYGRLIAQADVVIVGSFVPEGVAVAAFVLNYARGLVGFYDIDTPATLTKLARGDAEYLTPALVPRFDFYLSSASGAALGRLQDHYGARLHRVFSVPETLRLVETASDAVDALSAMTPAAIRALAKRARFAVLTHHTAKKRAEQLDAIIARARAARDEDRRQRTASLVATRRLRSAAPARLAGRHEL